MPMSFHKPQASSSPTQGNGLAKLPYNPSYQASPLEHINKNTQTASTTLTTTSMAVGGISALGEKPAQTPCGLSNLTSHGPSPVKQQLIRPKEAEAAGRLLVGRSQQNNAHLWHTNTFADCRSSSDPKGVASIRWQPPSLAIIL